MAARRYEISLRVLKCVFIGVYIIKCNISFVGYHSLLKTGSLDNAIREF